MTNNKTVPIWEKSNLTLDELYSAGMEGLTNAMNNYGKKTERNNVEEESIKAYTFLSYAAYMIRMMILADIQNHSHTVRIPVSYKPFTSTF